MQGNGNIAQRINRSRKKIHKAHDEKNDWYAFCKKCRKKIDGNIKELMEHHCAQAD